MQNSPGVAEIAHFLVILGVWLVKMASNNQRRFCRKLVKESQIRALDEIESTIISQDSKWLVRIT